MTLLERLDAWVERMSAPDHSVDDMVRQLRENRELSSELRELKRSSSELEFRSMKQKQHIAELTEEEHLHGGHKRVNLELKARSKEQKATIADLEKQLTYLRFGV